MRTHKAHFLAAVLLLAACSSETSKGTITPGDTTIPRLDHARHLRWCRGHDLARRLGAACRDGDAVLHGGPAGAFEAPDFVVSMLTLDGTRTDLWTENTGNGVTLLDTECGPVHVAAAPLRVKDANSGQSTETLSERDLASGTETVVTSMSESFNARYVQDGTGDILLKHDVDHADNTETDHQHHGDASIASVRARWWSTS